MSTAYRLGLYEKSMPNSLTLREKLTEARKAGFDYLELSIDESDEKLARLDWSAAEINQLCTDIREVNMPIHSICLSGHRKYPMGHPDAEVRTRSMQIMQKAILLANQLGVRLIQLAGYDVYYCDGNEETRALFISNLREAVQMASEYGVMLAFETMETAFMDTVEKAMAYVSLVNNAWLQIYPDTGNLTNAAVSRGTSVLADLEKGYGHIAALHLKESMPGRYREVPYGTGHVDFMSIACKAMQLGIRAFVGEFWYTGEPDWRRSLAEANAFLRDKLNAAAKQETAHTSDLSLKQNCRFVKHIGQEKSQA